MALLEARLLATPEEADFFGVLGLPYLEPHERSVETMERLWTTIARCGVCGKELNRAEHVPESERTMVTLAAPFVALCDVPAHNTFSDLNWKVRLEWVDEQASEQPDLQAVEEMGLEAKRRWAEDHA
jgi:hypothetical protein